MPSELSLVESGIITADDYVAAAARREGERPPLGQVAIEEGVLSVRQVLEVLSSQYASPGKRFGEIAVERGYLRSEQVATLLMRQAERQRPVIDHLVELGRLSLADADQLRHGLRPTAGPTPAMPV